MLWIPITLVACAAQVLRNGAQASLTGRIGTLGATQVRFVFGLPFAVLFLLAGLAITGEGLPHLNAGALRWGSLGAVVSGSARAPVPGPRGGAPRVASTQEAGTAPSAAAAARTRRAAAREASTPSPASPNRSV